jgi:hypothetical protein
MSDDAIDRMEAGDPRVRGDDSAMEEESSNDNEREGGRGRRVMWADEWAVLPEGEEKDEEVGDDGGVLGGAPNDGDDDGSGGAPPAANEEITIEECLKKEHPLHWACSEGASLDVIKYLVEEADDDKGKELLGKAHRDGNYPLHFACWEGASIDVIKYLVEEADGDNNYGKELLGKSGDEGMYPLHLACWKGASLEVIKYLVEEADGDKGKEPLGKADKYGRYPLHLACSKGASPNVIKYLIQKNPGPLQYKDMSGLTAHDYMDNNTLRAIFTQTHQIGSVADKSADIDRLNYLCYARALAYAAHQAEQPGTSLCVGLYGRYVAFTFTELICR